MEPPTLCEGAHSASLAQAGTLVPSPGQVSSLPTWERTKESGRLGQERWAPGWAGIPVFHSFSNATGSEERVRVVMGSHLMKCCMKKGARVWLWHPGWPGSPRPTLSATHCYAIAFQPLTGRVCVCVSVRLRLSRWCCVWKCIL